MAHEGLLTVFVIVTAAAVVVQAVILYAVMRTIAQLGRSVAQIQAGVEQDVQPLIRGARALVNGAQEPVHTILNNLADVSKLLRERAVSADAVVADVLDRTQAEVIRADELFKSLLARTERAADAVERGVLGPVRELSAVLAGVRAGFDYFVGRRRSAKPDRTPQEEQLFI